MTRFIEFILKHHKFVIISTLALTIWLGMYISDMDLNNEVDIYFDKSDPMIKVYHAFRDTFGNEEQAVILFHDENMFSNEKINMIREISQMAKDMPFVHRVFSITEQDEAVSENDFMSFRKVIPEGNLSSEELEAARSRALNNKILMGRFISSDANTVAIVVELEDTENSQDKIMLLTNLKKNATAIAQGRADLHFTGLPFIESEQNMLMVKDFFIIAPLMLFIIITIVQVSLRSVTMNIFSLVIINLTAIMTTGLFILTGENVNIVTSIMSPVLFAISIADIIHYLSHYRDQRIVHGKAHYEAVRDSARAIWLPCFFTSATTAVGFISFVTATIRPVRMLGIFTAFGVMLAFLLTVTFLPAVFILFSRFFEDNENLQQVDLNAWEEKNKKSPLLAFAMKNGQIATTYTRTITVIFLVLVVLAGYGATKIKFETNVTHFFDEDSAIIKDINFIEENMGGYLNGEIVINAASEQFDFTHPESLAILRKVQDYMLSKKEYTSSLSVADFIMEINRAFNNNEEAFYKVPQTRETIMDYYELGDADDIDRLVSADKMQARITYQSCNIPAEQGKKNIALFGEFVKPILRGNYTYNITGAGMLWLNMDDNLKSSFIKSLAFAFIIIFGMMIYVCKDVKLAAISMIPNLFPICLTVGIMGWLNIPFNTITIMIACVTLGIAVDDTVHFIVWFRRNSLSGLKIKEALLASYKSVGKPLIVTSIVLSLGFFILIFGSYRPMRLFGSLTALTIVFALFADLILLPALLLVTYTIEKRAGKRIQYVQRKLKVIFQGN